MDWTEFDMEFMHRALSLAQKGAGRVSPNPLVGAVIVKDGKIIGEGWHEGFGAPHAEANALLQAGKNARGATLYVTLEPCSHSGNGKKTPPCAPLVIKSGVARVVIAVQDPNPKVCGEGIRQIRDAGIKVDAGLMRKEAERQNGAFFKLMRTGLPFVTLKMAQSSNGVIGIRLKGGVKISGQEFDEYCHSLRNAHDGVLAGIGTVLADNPRLTCRMNGGRNPARVVLDGRLRIPLGAKVLRHAENEKVLIIASDDADAEKKAELERLGARVIACKNPRDAREVLQKLVQSGVYSILVEGGAEVAEFFVQSALADKLILCVSSKPISDGGAVYSPFKPEEMRKKLFDARERKMGADTVIEGYFSSWQIRK